MSRLILLNGPPACGKSTLARRYADEHPLTLNLDIDEIRNLLGSWRDHRPDAGILARRIAVAAARTHLASGRDVIVPQLLARPVFIDTLAELAIEAGAEFHEVVLVDTKPNMLRRHAERDNRLQGEPGDEELSELHDRLMALLPTRPRAHVIHVEDGRPDRTYQALRAGIRRHQARPGGSRGSR